MSATCEKCGNTGMLPGSKFLDCTSCDTAMIRVGLETWATENGIVADEDELWAIFKYGQSKAPASARQAYWNNVAAGLVEVKTAAERAAEDRHHKPHAVYVEQEVAELRARLGAMSQKEVVAGQ